MYRKLFIVITILALGLVGVQSAGAADVMRMATTTSTANTGLLDYLMPMFQKDTGIEVQFVAVGTGKGPEAGPELRCGHPDGPRSGRREKVR